MVVPKTKIITAEIETWMFDWLENSRKHGTTKTYNINEALRQYINRKKTVAKSV